ncbi:hypothetical protein BK382_20180 [Escherichia coli]|nr:hypothetical protein BK382_20180 [Escherichia coli]OJR52114.1 hypothetical protein BK381_03450 [Escherichia coli]OJS68027.1 hypothetical protein BK407_08710 [Escherichia coli]
MRGLCNILNLHDFVGLIRRSRRIRHEQSALCQQSDLLFESGNYRKAHAIIPNVTKLKHVPHSLHFRIWHLFLLRHWQ